MFLNDKKAFDMCSLEILARGYNKKTDAKYIVSLIDAKTEKIYVGIYEILDQEILKLKKIKEVATEVINLPNIFKANNLVNEKILIVSNDCEKYYNKIDEMVDFAELEFESEVYQTAKNIIAKYVELKLTGEILKNMKKETELLPNYLKKSQAEKNYEDCNFCKN